MALGLFSGRRPCYSLSRNVVSVSIHIAIDSSLTCVETKHSTACLPLFSDSMSDVISSMSLKCSVVLALKRSSGLPSSGSTSFSSSWLSLGKKTTTLSQLLTSFLSLVLLL